MTSKINHILDSAMNLLKESGDQGLTMRKVADASGMRLSNLQYYFKTRELLLGALLDGFLVEYAKAMKELVIPAEASAEKQMQYLTQRILSDVEKSDCAVVFKEIWAISERNAFVKQSVDAYYEKLYQMLFDTFKKVVPDCPDQQLDEAIAILLPFIEGYCITNSNIRVSSRVLSEQLASILYRLLIRE